MPTYERCHKAGVLRPYGRSGRTVSSEALHEHLGGAKYQEFIRFNLTHPKAHKGQDRTPGFAPAVVEEFLRNGKK